MEMYDARMASAAFFNITAPEVPKDVKEAGLKDIEEKFKAYLSTQAEDLNKDQVNLVFERVLKRCNFYSYDWIEEEFDKEYSFYHQMMRALLDPSEDADTDN